MEVARHLYEKGDRINKVPQRGTDFTGGHWDEPNVLVHLRLSDRKVGGKRTLLVEEIQSDWAQKGRSEGFKGPETQKRAKEIDAELEALYRSSDPPPKERVEALQAERDGIKYGSVPSAPFVKDTSKWTTLGLKRVLKMAADEGYDSVGIVRGQEQAARYDLSKQVSQVSWGEKDGLLRAWDKSGDPVIEKSNVSRAELAEHIGKEAAQKLVEQKPIDKLWDVEQVGNRKFIIIDETGKRVKDQLVGSLEYTSRAEAKKQLKHVAAERSLRGLELSVGGEGMKGYYDKIVPEQLNKLGKEYGIKVQIEGGKVGTPGTGDVIRLSSGKWTWRHQAEGLASRVKPRTYDTKEGAQAAMEKHTGGTTPIHKLDLPEPAREQIKRKGFPLVSRNGSLGSLITRTA